VDTARVEAHLLDWSADCYGRGLSLDLREFRRSEQRFDGLDALRSAIAADVVAARRLLDPSTQSA
jgi:riboflavin kinase/FMN adenylyltransferase